MQIPAEAYEDRIEIDLGRVETVPNPPSELERSAYPYPVLRLAQGSETRVLRTLVLENALVKAVFLPDLGGRLYSLFDKRTQRETFPSVSLTKVETRGVEWRQGLRWAVDLPVATDLAPVDFQFLEPDEDGSATLVLASFAAGQNVAWHAFITLLPDLAELRVEFRAYNRSLQVTRFLAPFALDSPSLGSGPTWSAFSGWALWFEKGDLSPAGRRWGANQLGGRALDVFGLRIAPIEVMSRVLHSSPEASLGLCDGQLRLQVSEASPGAKLVVEVSTGDILEAVADLIPERPFAAELPAEPTAFVLMDSAGRERLRWPAGEETAPGFEPLPQEYIVKALLRGESPDPYQLQMVAGWPTDCRHLAAWAKACESHTVAAVDDYLAKNAEDPRAWILRAILCRLNGIESEDALNAHFLTPMDPLLRMERWLAQNDQSREPSPLVAPMAEDPDHMVDGACFLLETRLYEELARWCDECLRHREIPMLRYLMAAALLRRGRMPVEAAELVRRAGQTPVNPPYPWRDIEWVVLEELGARFPEDARIAELLRMASR